MRRTAGGLDPAHRAVRVERQHMRASALAVALAALPAPPPAHDEGAQDDGFWQSDFAAARKTAAEHGKPLLLLFRCER